MKTDFNLVKLFDKKYYMNKKYKVIDDKVKSQGNPKNTLFDSVSFVIKSIFDIFNHLSIDSKKPKSAWMRAESNQEEYIDVPRSQEYFHEPEDGANWIPIDADNYELPDSMDPCSEDALKYFINKELPSCFQNVSFVYQFSNSAGILDEKGEYLKTGLNAHIFYFCDKGITNKQLKFLLKEAKGVDKSLYSTNQIIYTAEPYIRDGITYRLEKRLGMVEYDSVVVEVPDIPDYKEYHKELKRINLCDVPLDEEKVEKISTVLKTIGCVFGARENSYNLWHHKESKSIGSWVWYFNNPEFVWHPKNHWKLLYHWVSEYWGQDKAEMILELQVSNSHIINYLTPNEASKEVEDNILSFIEGTNSMILCAPSGIGKTHSALKLIPTVEAHVDYLVDKHKLAEDSLNTLERVNEEVTYHIYKGRNQEGMCPRYEHANDSEKKYIKLLEEYGQSIYTNCCLNSTYNNNCNEKENNQ